MNRAASTEPFTEILRHERCEAIHQAIKARRTNLPPLAEQTLETDHGRVTADYIRCPNCGSHLIVLRDALQKGESCAW